MDSHSPRSLTSGLPRPRFIQLNALRVAVLGLALWGTWFIYRTSFEIDGERFFVLFDDAMISMTYARNFVEGYRLSWAREGEPVEGFTTPLWTALMIPTNTLPLPLSKRSLVVQLLSLALLAANLVAIKRLTERFFGSGEQRSWLPAVALTAFYYPLNYWSLMGMETGLQALLTTLSVLFTYEIVIRGENRAVALSVVLALAYLTRMDMALLIVAVLGFLTLQGGMRRAERSSWFLGLGIVLLAILGYQTFRILYYGVPLPNTYYLKLTGIPFETRLLQGLATYADFFREHAVPLLIILLGALPLSRRRIEFRLPLILFALYSLYSIYVGGDSWDETTALRANRFLAFVMPLLFVTFAGLWNSARSALARAFSSHSSTTGDYLTIVATTVLVLITNGLGTSKASAEHWWNLVVAERPALVPSHEIVLRDVKRLEALVAPGARVATFWAGVPSYFSDYRMVDMYGYSDASIARLQSAVPLHVNNFRAYRPGHVKWDYTYVFREKPPDAFLQVWHTDEKTLSTLMEKHGYREMQNFWIRTDAPLRDSSRLHRG